MGALERGITSSTGHIRLKGHLVRKKIECKSKQGGAESGEGVWAHLLRAVENLLVPDLLWKQRCGIQSSSNQEPRRDSFVWEAMSVVKRCRSELQRRRKLLAGDPNPSNYSRIIPFMPGADPPPPPPRLNTGGGGEGVEGTFTPCPLAKPSGSLPTHKRRGGGLEGPRGRGVQDLPSAPCEKNPT